MDVTFDEFYFWSVVEADLKIKVPSYIKNVLKFRSFSNALVFQTINNDDLTDAEKFVRVEMVAKLTEIKEKTPFDDKILKQLFGTISPEQFSFNTGDRRLVEMIRKYVESTANTGGENKNLAHFRIEKPTEKTVKEAGRFTCNTPFGVLFKDSQVSLLSTIIEKQVKKPLDLVKTKERLFANSKKLFDSYGFDLGQYALTIDSIKVEMFEETFDGSVLCLYCKMDQKHYMVKVFWSKTKWILSNLNTHIKKFHRQIHDGKIASPLKLVPPTNNAGDEIEDFAQQFPSVESKSTAELSEILFNQICCQISRFKDVEENVDTFIAECSSDSIALVEICNVIPDGDCLFRSLAHQLNAVKMNSQSHEKFSMDLRKEVSDFIQKNFGLFKHELEDRVRETSAASTTGKKKKDEKAMYNQCKDFLDNLSKFVSCWGGSETLKAISLIYNVNLIIINDDGTAKMNNRFKESNEKCVVIAHCTEKGSVLPRNNYHSVIEIDGVFLKNLCGQIAEQENCLCEIENEILQSAVIPDE